MSEILATGLAFFAGAFLSAFFFGGLWWTIQKGVVSEWPALWFFGSLLLRTVVIMAGFYFISQDHWSRFIACILGFMVMRVVIVNWFTRPAETEPANRVKENGNAT
jgi:F1F0 ATPase subunit 2